MKSTAFAPTKYTGTGILYYKVRANFATRSGKVSSAFSPTATFIRLISAPPAPRMTRTKTRLVFGWGAAAAAVSYRVEVSASDSFATLIDSVTTGNTSFAPELIKPGYRNNGPLYWRVATVDDGNNVGAFTTSMISAGKSMKVKLIGKLRRSKTSRIKVVVRGSNGKALSTAKVTVKGPGMPSKSKRTGKKGTTTFSVRPKSRGAVTFTVSRSGYRDKVATLRVP